MFLQSPGNTQGCRLGPGNKVEWGSGMSWGHGFLLKHGVPSFYSMLQDFHMKARFFNSPARLLLSLCKTFT